LRNFKNTLRIYPTLLQNRVRLYQYFYWSLYNCFVKFGYQKFTDTCYVEGHCEISIAKNGNPRDTDFLQDVLAIFGPNFVAIRQIGIRYQLKKRHSRKIKVPFFRYKRFMNISRLCWATRQHR